MTVKITKPEINVREKIRELDKPSGVAGQAILAAETPQEQFNLIGAGRRNLIINGDFLLLRVQYCNNGSAHFHVKKGSLLPMVALLQTHGMS